MLWREHNRVRTTAQLLPARRSSNSPRARRRHWRAAGRAVFPATGAPSAPEASGHPKWMPMPPPTPSEPCAVSVAPAAHDQCPTSTRSTCARSSSPSPCAQMLMLLAELRASAASKSSKVASWTLLLPLLPTPTPLPPSALVYRPQLIATAQVPCHSCRFLQCLSLLHQATCSIPFPYPLPLLTLCVPAPTASSLSRIRILSTFSPPLRSRTAALAIRRRATGS